MKLDQKHPIIMKKFPILAILIFLFFNPTYAEEAQKDSSSVTAGKAIQLSSYAQVQYSASGKAQDSFILRRVRVSLSGEVLKNIRYKLQVDTVKSPILLDANIEFMFKPSLVLRIGQFKVPFSLENLTSSSDLDTINRSITEEKLCPGRDIGSQGRDIGAILAGKYSFLEWTLGIFNGSGINRADTNEEKDIAGRIVFHPAGFMAIGAAFYEGRYSPSSGGTVEPKDRTGLELRLNYSEYSLKGEYIFGKDGQISKEGWYLQGGYFILPKKLQVLTKYDSYGGDKNLAQDGSRVITLGINWFLVGKNKLQINYELHRDESGRTVHRALLAQFQAAF
ncbi:MAG: porin [Candidatus Aminicenantales bacterium]